MIGGGILGACAGQDVGVRQTGLLFPAISEAGCGMLQQGYERELSFAPEVQPVARRGLSSAEPA